MEKSQIYKVQGMHCASCAHVIEHTLQKIQGVTSVQVNFGTESVKVVVDSPTITPELLSKKIENFGYSLIIDKPANPKKEKTKELSKLASQLHSIIPIAIFSIIVMGWDILTQLSVITEMNSITKEFIHHLLPLLAIYALVVVGKPYLQGAYRFFRYGKANMDSLIGIGTSTAFLYSFIISAFEEPLRLFINVEHTYYDVTIVVIAFITLGKYLETKSKIKTGDAIEKLINLQTKTALIIKNGVETEIPITDVHHSDILIIKPGAKIPVDGIVSEGSSYIDESMITGEPMAVHKKVGDSVIAGTINTTGSFMFTATKIGSETVLAQIIALVEQAQNSKAPIQSLADKISAIFVPIVLVIAILALGSWILFGSDHLGFAQALSYGLTSFVGVLVIACPCALGLATPTAIIVGVGKGAKEGILIKNATNLQTLSSINTLVIDKTGTITKGKPSVTGLHNFSSQSDAALLSILASLEKKSEHPIAEAIISHAELQKINSNAVTNFQAHKGMGISGSIEGNEYFAGNETLLRLQNIPFNTSEIHRQTNEGKTLVFLASKKELLACILIADEIRPESIKAVQDIKKMGVDIMMLTGDNETTAQYVATQVGITNVAANLLPEDKLIIIKEQQKLGKIIAMAGDGINDAPALTQANVGIAMGTGTDVAIESAGVILLHGDISKISKSIRLSSLTMAGIKQNLFWAFIYNIIGIPLAAGLLFPFFGLILNPIFAGLAMAFSSVSVVANSLRLKNKAL